MAPLVGNEHLEVFSEHHKKQTKPLQDFMWDDSDHFHATRRKQILAKYPEVESLFGHEPFTVYLVTAIVVTQTILAACIGNHYDKWWYYVLAYVIGATCNHALFLAIHEITHNLAFKSVPANRLFAMFANLPIVFPYSVSFKEYHFDHHRFLAVEGLDPDLPTKVEAVLFQNVLGKALFCFLQIFFYALRPIFIRVKKPNGWHLTNLIIQLVYDGVMIYFFGWHTMTYLLLCSFLAGSFHPCAGHFIAEHYAFVPGYETYSYYGPMNAFSFNVGYHNEHHDFPTIPWTRLPILNKIAPEFYDNLPFHTSWMQVIYEFITNPNYSLYSRVKKQPKQKKTN